MLHAILAVGLAAAAASAPLRLLRSVGSPGSALGQFSGPRHVSPTGDGGCCVVDGLNERLVMLDHDLRAVRSIDGLSTPTGVAIVGDELFVAESTGAHCVSRLRLSDGELLCSAGGLGEGDGDLHDPQCLALAGQLLLVAEWGNNRISVFERARLRFERHIGDDSGRGALDQPCGIAVHAGELFVADRPTHRALPTTVHLPSVHCRGLCAPCVWLHRWRTRGTTASPSSRSRTAASSASLAGAARASGSSRTRRASASAAGWSTRRRGRGSACRCSSPMARRRATHGALARTVHLPLGAVLSPCTMCVVWYRHAVARAAVAEWRLALRHLCRRGARVGNEQ